MSAYVCVAHVVRLTNIITANFEMADVDAEDWPTEEETIKIRERKKA